MLEKRVLKGSNHNFTLETAWHGCQTEGDGADDSGNCPAIANGQLEKLEQQAIHGWQSEQNATVCEKVKSYGLTPFVV